MRGLPFEARFLRYMMLRITPVGMTEGGLAFFGEESMCFLGAVEPLRGWCLEETDHHSSLKRACVYQEGNPSSASVIPSEVEESGRQW